MPSRTASYNPTLTFATFSPGISASFRDQIVRIAITQWCRTIIDSPAGACLPAPPMHSLRQRRRKAFAVARYHLPASYLPRASSPLCASSQVSWLKPGSGGDLPPTLRARPHAGKHTARRGFLTACRAEPPPASMGICQRYTCALRITDSV